MGQVSVFVPESSRLRAEAPSFIPAVVQGMAQGWGKQNIFGQAHYLGEHTERSNRTVCEAHSAKCKAFRLLGGSGGMPPQKNFENITF